MGDTELLGTQALVPQGGMTASASIVRRAMNDVRGRTEPKLKVRLRHRWVTLITVPLSEEQASLMAVGGVEAVKPLGEKTVNYTDPLCWRCEQEWEEQTHSCPGEAAS